MNIEYYKDKYIQVLQEKIGLQDRINSLLSEVIDLKAQQLKRQEPDERQKVVKTRKRRSRQDELEVESVSSVQDSSGSECEGDPWDMIPLTTVIDDRHSGTVGALTNRGRQLLMSTTAQFLKKYNLENGPNYIPRGYVNKYNSYLDRKIDEGLFNSPKKLKKKRIYKIDAPSAQSPFRNKIKAKPAKKPMEEIVVDPAVASLFDNEPLDKTPSLSFREKVVLKHQQKKISPQKVADSEQDSMAEDSPRVDEPAQMEKDQNVIVVVEEEVAKPTSDKEEMEIDLASKDSEDQNFTALEAPVIINEGLSDIENLMDSTGYNPPAKTMPISFDESRNKGDFESQIFNRVSGSVVESSKSTQGWIPWDLLLKQRLDKDIGVEKRFITFTMNFCTENGIAPKSVSVGTHSSMGIPPNLFDKYVKAFTLRFSPSSSAGSAFIEEVLEEGVGASESLSQPEILKPQSHLLLSMDSPTQEPSRLSPIRANPEIISVIPSFDQVSSLTPNSSVPGPLNEETGKKEPPMTRFNILLTNLMPNYNTQDKEKRLIMKKNVLQWLRSKLGNENVKLCKLQARAHDTVFTTFGIPKFIEASFIEWAREELKQLFPESVI